MKKILAFLIISIPVVASADIISTGRGKIEFTEGHTVPNCRTVSFKDNNTNISKTFRISSATGTDINSVILTALTAKNDVQIWFDEAVTTGCGNEPRIQYIRIYTN